MTTNHDALREAQTHELKTWPEYFEAIVSGEKTFELRKDDRDFQVGDALLLREWDPITREYTGKSTRRVVSYILRNAWFGIADGYVVLSISQPMPEAAAQGWKPIDTAPRDGSLIIVRGNNYNDAGNGQHHAIACWHNGCWMEASDWNPTGELTYLTDWAPMPPESASASPAAPEGAKPEREIDQPQAQPTPSPDDIHSCGEFCDLPECVAAREAQAQKEPEWICPRCRVNRLKAPCSGPPGNCPMKGEAQ